MIERRNQRNSPGMLPATVAAFGQGCCAYKSGRRGSNRRHSRWQHAVGAGFSISRTRFCTTKSRSFCTTFPPSLARNIVRFPADRQYLYLRHGIRLSIRNLHRSGERCLGLSASSRIGDPCMNLYLRSMATFGLCCCSRRTYSPYRVGLCNSLVAKR